MRAKAARMSLCGLLALGLATSPLLPAALAQTTRAQTTRAQPTKAQATTPASAPLSVLHLSGRVELLAPGNVWRAATGASAVRLGLRTGTGRARLTSRAGGYVGSVLVGSASRLRTYRGEADLLEGTFLLDGPVAVHLQGRHVVMERAGRARVDFGTDGEAPRRVAVISGAVRVALAGRVVRLGAGQQLDLTSGRLSAFQEDDPWYAAQFTGIGNASVQATRGPVRVSGLAAQLAVTGETLDPGERLSTGAGAWAEVGFSGGGYLRLQEQSELSVVSAVQTERGREVTLQLTRGSAWNVVQRSLQGYRLSTPVVSTASRGTVFRVDAGGLVKVFEGEVALPSPGSAAVTQGRQRTPNGTLAPLRPDAVDSLNQQLDAERARLLTLRFEPGERTLRNLTLAVRTLPDARVTVSVAGRQVPLRGQGGVFRLGRLDPPLPEGTATVRVRAERQGQVRTLTRTFVIDRTAPSLGNLRAETVGRTLTLGGSVRDAGSSRVTLTVRLGDSTFTRRVEGDFELLLPAPEPGTPLRVTVRDEAGNESHASLP